MLSEHFFSTSFDLFDSLFVVFLRMTIQLQNIYETFHRKKLGISFHFDNNKTTVFFQNKYCRRRNIVQSNNCTVDGAAEEPPSRKIAVYSFCMCVKCSRNTARLIVRLCVFVIACRYSYSTASFLLGGSCSLDIQLPSKLNKK